jgi:hypothetical protein
MKATFKIKFLVPLLLFTVFACKKTTPGIPVMQMSDMPLKGGDSWSYAVTNYPATETDTAMFQVLNAASVFNGTITYYTSTTVKNALVDSGTINQGGASVTYHGNNGVQTFAGSGLFDGWVLTFPINSQSSWSASGGTIKVIAASASVTVGNNSYSNVYTLLRTVITPGGVVNDTMLIAPNVGIIKYDGFPLVSYHVQ